MATALDILKRSSALAGERAFNAGLNPIKQADYLALLNELIDGWRNEGIDLELSTLTSGDTVYVDDADLISIRYALAVLIMENEGSPLKPTVLNRAGELQNSLRSKYHSIRDLEVPLGLRSRHNSTYDINQE